jgi:hypothetical protein
MTLHLDKAQESTRDEEVTWREFFVKREGLRWKPVYQTNDGVVRSLNPLVKFWSRTTAMRVASIASQHWHDGLYVGAKQ